MFSLSPYVWRDSVIGHELAAIKAERPDAPPLAPYADIGHLDVALPDTRLALASFRPSSVRAEVVRLYPHLFHTILLGALRRRSFF